MSIMDNDLSHAAFSSLKSSCPHPASVMLGKQPWFFVVFFLMCICMRLSAAINVQRIQLGVKNVVLGSWWMPQVGEGSIFTSNPINAFQGGESTPPKGLLLCRLCSKPSFVLQSYLPVTEPYASEHQASSPGVAPHSWKAIASHPKPCEAPAVCINMPRSYRN